MSSYSPESRVLPIYAQVAFDSNHSHQEIADLLSRSLFGGIPFSAPDIPEIDEDMECVLMTQLLGCSVALRGERDSYTLEIHGRSAISSLSQGLADLDQAFDRMAERSMNALQGDSRLGVNDISSYVASVLYGLEGVFAPTSTS